MVIVCDVMDAVMGSWATSTPVNLLESSGCVSHVDESSDKYTS